MITLKLFNAVISKTTLTNTPYVSNEGIIIEPDATWAKDKIIEYYKKQRLSGNDLNKTFHKSWKKVTDSSRFKLLLEQIIHYISTYGTNFQGEVYIPDECLNLPDVKLCYKVIKAYTKEELIVKCFSLLNSGIALKEETINDVLTLLVDELKYEFTGNEKIKNKEAVVKLADAYGIIPNDTMEFFRYIIYRTTGKSLLIKNKQTIEAIKESNTNAFLSVQLKKHGLENLATIFNRYKPLFLAFKDKCPATINRISKLSKFHHKPMIVNPLNKVTSELLKKTDEHWLKNATIYSLFKALSACHTRINKQDCFCYRIRNGKSWSKNAESNISICKKNYTILLDYLKSNYSLAGKKIFIKKNVIFGLPTSEKMYVGNIPTGTKFYGKKLAVGVYWKDSWGERDLDLSGMTMDGNKVGWNASYYTNNKGLIYSGDMTSAPNGAVEYLYANSKLKQPTLIMNNVFHGENDCEYKIIIGKGDKISKEYMMNPNNLFAEIKCKSIQQMMVLGILLQEDEEKQCFTLLNFGAGNIQVSKHTKSTEMIREALLQQYTNYLSFNEIVKLLGAEIVKEEPYDYKFDLDIEKDAFIKLFVDLKNVK